MRVAVGVPGALSHRDTPAILAISARAGRWYGRCRRYGDMGEGEILRLWANVWLSPAGLPEEGRVQACQNSAKAGELPPVEVTRFSRAFAAACR